MNEEVKTTFETLEVWQESRKLRMEISVLVKDFPDEEKYRLVDQMIRAARSISGNIAEGHGRFHFQENIQFSRRARGAISELLDHLYVAFDDKYIPEEKFNYFRSKSLHIEKMVDDHIVNLTRQKHAQSATSRPPHASQATHSSNASNTSNTTHTSHTPGKSNKPHAPHPGKSTGGKQDGVKRL